MTNLISQDGELYYLPSFIPTDDTIGIFARLRQDLDWQEEVVTIVGRKVLVPRLVAWHGDEGAIYQYSGLIHYPQPWTDTLLVLKQTIETSCGQTFNSVLGNLYRNGQDSMGWHADQEKVLGKNPYIASLSFGQERQFKIRHNKSGETLDIPLADGSLLIMAGTLQHHWRHCVPKSAKANKPRINLTFRTVYNTSASPPA